jgi:hypothetical protein
MTSKEHNPFRLGPVPCRGCRRLVVLVETWRDFKAGHGWHERRWGRKHDCPAIPKYERERMLADYRRARLAA